MAASYLNTYSAYTAAGSSLTITSVATSGSDRVIFVAVRYITWGSDDSKISGIARNSENFTRLYDGNKYPPSEQNVRHEVWALAAPATGTYDVAVTFTSSQEYIEGVAVVVDGTIQSAWDVQTSELDRDASGDAETLGATLTLGSSDVGIAIAWVNEDAAGVLTDPAFTAGTERLTTDNGYQHHLRVATFTGSGSTTATIDLDIVASGVGSYWGAARLHFIHAESSSPSTSDTNGSISGTATLTGEGASTASAAGSISGQATLTAATASSATADGSIQAEAILSGVGASSVTTVGSIVGQAALTAEGTTLGAVSTDGTITATATLSGVGASVAAADGSIAGSATLSGVGATTGGVTAADGSITSSATLTGVGASIAAADGSITAEAELTGYTIEAAQTQTGGLVRPRVSRQAAEEEEELEVFAALAGAALRAAVLRRQVLSRL